MRHAAARRRLSGLPDGLLAPAEETAVRGHLEACRRCRRVLAELEASEILLRRIPATVIPLSLGDSGDGRLQGLARWVSDAGAPPKGLAAWRFQALGAMVTFLVAVAGMAFGPVSTDPVAHAEDGSRQMVVAVRMPMTFVTPVVEASSAVVPYSWRQ